MANAQAPLQPSRRHKSARTLAPEKSPVRAVQRAFDLLGLLAAAGQQATLSELARDSSLPVSTVARLLAALEHSGFVRRDSESRYGPGTRLLQVGLASLRSLSVYDLAEPHLRRLSEQSGETANLAVRADAANAVYLRQVISPQSIHHAAWLGRMLALKKAAVGAVLLGETPASGYVARRDTLDVGVTAIAGPVYGAAGEIVAALSITGPTYRIDDRDAARYGALVVRECALASAALGAPSDASRRAASFA
jgi:IclR family transcriptional regulator, acetate operon repressor